MNKIKKFTLLLFAVVGTLKANQITGQFDYTSTGFPSAEFPVVAIQSEEPAFFIFDIPSQELRIFNFTDRWLSHSFGRHRIFSVSRRDSTDPVTTLSELFDFQEILWDGSKLLDYGDGMVLYRDFTISVEGDWSASEYGGIWGIGTDTYGKILGYWAYTPTLEEKEIQIEQRNEFIDVSFSASSGYAQKLMVSYNLSQWFEVPNAGSNFLQENSYVSSLFKTYQLSESESSAFFKVMIEPLTFEE